MCYVDSVMYVQPKSNTSSNEAMGRSYAKVYIYQISKSCQPNCDKPWLKSLELQKQLVLIMLKTIFIISKQKMPSQFLLNLEHHCVQRDSYNLK